MERIVLSITHRGRITNNWVIEETSHRCDQMYQKMADNHQQIMRQTETSHITHRLVTLHREMIWRKGRPARR